MLIPLFVYRSGESTRVSDAERLSFVSQAIDASVDAIVFTDTEGRITFANRAFVRLWGYERANDVGGRFLSSFVRAVNGSGAMDVRTNWAGEALGVAAKGAPFPIAGSITRLEDLAHRPVGFVASFRDVSDRARAERALRESEERLNQAVRTADIGIFDHDHVSGHCYWSPELRRIVGWPAGASPPPPPFDVETAGTHHLIHPDDRDRVAQAVARSLDPRSDGVHDIEYRFTRPDGQSRWLKVKSQTFFHGEGEVRQRVRTVGAVQDVTEQKTNGLERERLRDQLTQAQKMESVGRLAGGIAHDFNNMLSVITGHAELALRATSENDPVRADLEYIKTAAARAADLTRQLLGFARRQVAAPRVLDLNRAVTGSLAMLRRLIGEDIELVWIPGALVGRVRVDPHQVDQILANLAANARDAISGVGRLTIETGAVELDVAAAARHELSPGCYTVLRVADNGRGMDAGTAAHAFEPFFTTKPVGHGTGLGLATVYGIVKQNNGCVEVDTEVDRGASVRIFLPSVEGDVSETSTASQSGTPRPGHETVLLVEDESAVLRLSRTVLERFGYTVLTAASPGEAIQLFGAHDGQVHLLVTDVVMPEMNGRELAAKLRAARPELKTLFVSGYSASALAPRGVLEEGVHFLQKPFSLEDLAASVRAALDAPQI